MKVSIFGLGYVGCVSAACLAARGHAVIGVDPASAKVDLINRGKAPLIEPGLSELLDEAVKSEKLRATQNVAEAIHGSDVSIICVGTPSRDDGSLDTQYLEHACLEAGAALKDKKEWHVIAVRSTTLPGTTRSLVIPTLEKASGKRAGKDFGVCYNPEFMREGSSVHDFNNPPKTVIGETEPKSGDIASSLYEGLPCPLIRCAVEVAEMIKYADNAWHATKVAFANEIGNFCKESGIDSHKVMEIFFKDTKLNLSSYYMRPGFAFGGSCLPKDVRALTAKAASLNLNMPLLGALIPSNEEQLARGVRLIRSLGKKNVGFLGFSFKAHTDDLRESPMVEAIRQLKVHGLAIRLYDKNVTFDKLIGANRDYILRMIPDLRQLMVGSMEQLIAQSEIIVIGNNAPEFAQAAAHLKPHHQVVDFVRVKAVEEAHGQYHGICW